MLLEGLVVDIKAMMTQIEMGYICYTKVIGCLRVESQAAPLGCWDRLALSAGDPFSFHGW